jgi:hypothetical protein
MDPDRVGIDPACQIPGQLLRAVIEIEQRLRIVAPYRHRRAVDLDHLDHPPAGGKGDQLTALGGVGQGQLVRTGMRCPQLGDPHLERDAGSAQCLDRTHQPLVPCLPSQQAAAQSHIRALAVVRRRQRAMHVILDEGTLQRATHQVARQPADAQRSRTVRAGRAAHHRADDLVQDAGIGRGGDACAAFVHVYRRSGGRECRATVYHRCAAYTKHIPSPAGGGWVGSFTAGSTLAGICEDAYPTSTPTVSAHAPVGDASRRDAGRDKNLRESASPADSSAAGRDASLLHRWGRPGGSSFAAGSTLAGICEDARPTRSLPHRTSPTTTCARESHAACDACAPSGSPRRPPPCRPS